jgi:hypothetical protein
MRARCWNGERIRWTAKKNYIFFGVGVCGSRPLLASKEEEEITSFQPHQADETTYKQESVELVYLTLGMTVG